MRCLIGMTGSSGARYGVRLLEALEGEKELVVSRAGLLVLEQETGLTVGDLSGFVSRVHDDSDLAAAPASGSHPMDAVIVCPCSQSTMAKMAAGIADTLLTRAASVALKEGRRLIAVPRETPVSAIMLENELRLVRAGATVLPASPGFYHGPRSVDDMVDFVVGKILDQLGQRHDLFRRWEPHST